jgi:hypothetical protein
MVETANPEKGQRLERSKTKWRSFFGQDSSGNNALANDTDGDEARPTKWSMGVLNDKTTHEVPGMSIIAPAA